MGKTHLCKNILKKLQNECPKQQVVLILASFPDEWKKSEKDNDDKHVYIKQGNSLEVFDKSKGDIKV